MKLERSGPIVDKRVAHLADDGTRTLALKFCSREEVKRVSAQSAGILTERRLDHADLCRGGVKPGECAPIVNNQSGTYYV